MGTATIGFIGLGGMGQAIALNLLRAGHGMMVWNRSPGSAQPLAAEGAHVAAKAEEVGEASIVFSMLADDHAARSVILDGGVLDAMRPDAVWVNLATVSVAFAREMAGHCRDRGLGYVAAPVLGRPDAAASGKLQILAAGDPDQLAKVQPLLDVVGAKTWRLGDEPEKSNAAKLATNFMIAAAIEAMGEAVTLAEGYGVSGPSFLDMIASTLFASTIYKGYGGMIAKRRYEPAGFAMKLALKDIRLVLEAAEHSSMPMPFASVLKDSFLDGIAHGDGHKDWSALADTSARRAGRTT